MPLSCLVADPPRGEGKKYVEDHVWSPQLALGPAYEWSGEGVIGVELQGGPGALGCPWAQHTMEGIRVYGGVGNLRCALGHQGAFGPSIPRNGLRCNLRVSLSGRALGPQVALGPACHGRGQLVAP